VDALTDRQTNPQANPQTNPQTNLPANPPTLPPTNNGFNLLRPVNPVNAINPIIPPVANLSDPEEWNIYPLGAGDQISVIVQPPFQELSTNATLAFDGSIFLPLLGKVSLSGLTLDQSTDLLKKAFDRYVVDPDVRVVLNSPRPAQVTISGAVLRPGYFPIAPNSFVHQALLTAGGVRIEADLQNVIVQRRRSDGTLIEQAIDLYTPIAQGTPLPDVRLRDGDTIIVPERDLLFDSPYDRELLRRTPLVAASDRPVQITVLGEVGRPGYYEFSPSSPPIVSQVILSAQGAKSTADLRRVSVRRQLRDGTVLEREIDLYTPLVAGAAVPTLPLEQGDVVFVPEIPIEDIDNYERELLARSTIANPQIKVRLIARAADRAAPVQLQNGATLADILAQVPFRDSNLRHVALIRFNPETETTETIYYDGREALYGDETQDVLLMDNDVVVVGRTLIAGVSNFLNRFTQPFRDVLGFLLFFDSLSNSADSLFRPSSSSSSTNRNTTRSTNR